MIILLSIQNVWTHLLWQFYLCFNARCDKKHDSFVFGVVMELAQVDEDGEVVRNTWQDCTEGCPGTDFECNEGKSGQLRMMTT